MSDILTNGGILSDLREKKSTPSASNKNYEVDVQNWCRDNLRRLGIWNPNPECPCFDDWVKGFSFRFKEYAKIKDGHFGTIKGCYSSIAALALRMKPDECVVGFEENCRRQIGLRSQKTNITDLISRTAGRDFLAQYCNNVGTGMANQGYEMSKCLCTGNLCNSASMLSFCIFPILIIFFIFSVM